MYRKTKLIRVRQLYSFFCLSLAVFIFGCNHGSKQYDSPACYNLNKPYLIKLPPELKEISGIAYYSKDNSLFAESDAKGALYKIFLNKPTDIRKWKYSHKKDYEDIVLHDSTFFILNNNGDITALTFVNDSLVPHEYTFPENGKYEFESLYYDDQLQKLVLICKDCALDKEASVSTYSFDPKQFTYGSSYSIETKIIGDIAGPSSAKFKPSGASINPVTGELYILSSINKVLVVASRAGVIKDVYKLDPALFGQPEGITFSPNGGLFISNEAGTTTAADILYLQLNKSETK
jgi:hypothetical protein